MDNNGIEDTTIGGNLKGESRKTLIQLHRLLEFQKAFDAYLAGEVSAEAVKLKAKKMLQAGMPEFKRGRL